MLILGILGYWESKLGLENRTGSGVKTPVLDLARFLNIFMRQLCPEDPEENNLDFFKLL